MKLDKLPNNKYIKWYLSIIERPFNDSEYLESHHIIPKCLDGDNRPSNIKKLPAREHYICHFCLYKAFKKEYGRGHEKTRKLFFSFNMMTKSPNHSNRSIRSREYSFLRKNLSQYMKDHTMSEEGRKRLSDLKRETYWAYNQKGQENPHYGKKLSEEHKRKIRENNKGFSGMNHTKETKQKMRESKIGKYEGPNNPNYGNKHSKEVIERIKSKNTQTYKVLYNGEEFKCYGIKSVITILKDKGLSYETWRKKHLRTKPLPSKYDTLEIISMNTQDEKNHSV